MPRAEAGSSKALSNQLKSKGLTRLRWYCQACEKACRDANAFKQHTMSESHVRQMLLLGENKSKHIHNFSTQFKGDFLQLLRTSHGEKKVNLNHFYQEYIQKRDHIHMNATQWKSLTEFGKYLGREAICRVEEGERGLEIAWIDNSPEALRRQDAIRKKERQDKGDEERSQKQIAEQVERAKRDAEEKLVSESNEYMRALERQEGERIKISFNGKTSGEEQGQLVTVTGSKLEDKSLDAESDDVNLATMKVDKSNQNLDRLPSKVGLTKPKNVFGSMTRKHLSNGSKYPIKTGVHKPISEAERIMRAEIDRKRVREDSNLRNLDGKKART